MDPKPPKPHFDPVKACFYLIAAVIMAQVLVALAGAAMCLVYADDVMGGKINCDRNNRLSELLSAALSAALAFAGGFLRNPPPPPPPPSPPASS